MFSWQCIQNFCFLIRAFLFFTITLQFIDFTYTMRNLKRLRRGYFKTAIIHKREEMIFKCIFFHRIGTQSNWSLWTELIVKRFVTYLMKLHYLTHLCYCSDKEWAKLMQLTIMIYQILCSSKLISWAIM